MNFTEVSESRVDILLGNSMEMYPKSRGIALFDAAKSALAEAVTVDDIMEVSSRLAAIQEYGRQWNDKSLEINSAKLRIRAKRRIGELLIVMKEEGTLYREHPSEGRIERKRKESRELARAKAQGLPRRIVKTLKQLNVSPRLSSEAQAYARIEKDKFERNVAEWEKRAQEDKRITVAASLPKTMAPRRKTATIVARTELKADKGGMIFHAFPGSGLKQIGSYTVGEIEDVHRRAIELFEKALWDVEMSAAVLEYRHKMTTGKSVGETISRDILKRMMQVADTRVRVMKGQLP